MPVTCQSTLPDGQICDVVAVGRCRNCSKAFCGSHQEVLLSRSGFDGLVTQLPQNRCGSCAADAVRAQGAASWKAHVEESQELDRLASEVQRLTAAIVSSPRAQWVTRKMYLKHERAGFFRQRAVYDEHPPAVSIGMLHTVYSSDDAPGPAMTQWGLTKDCQLVRLYDGGIMHVQTGTPATEKGKELIEKQPWQQGGPFPEKWRDSDLDKLRYLVPRLQEAAKKLGIAD